MDEMSQLVIKQLAEEQRHYLMFSVMYKKVKEEDFLKVFNEAISLTEIVKSGMDQPYDVMHVLNFENCCKFFYAICKQYLDFLAIGKREGLSQSISLVSNQTVEITLNENPIRVELGNSALEVDEIINLKLLNNVETIEKVVNDAFAKLVHKLRFYNNTQIIDEEKRNYLSSLIEAGVRYIQEAGNLKRELLLNQISLDKKVK